MSYAERRVWVILGSGFGVYLAGLWAVVALRLPGDWAIPAVLAATLPFSLWWVLHARAVRRHLSANAGMVCPRCGYACPGGRRVYVCTECGRSYSQHDAEWFARRWSRRPWWIRSDRGALWPVVFVVLAYAVGLAFMLLL